MASNSRYEAWLKQHKNCKLFMESALNGKRSWGRGNMDRMKTPYGFPKDLKASLYVAKKR